MAEAGVTCGSNEVGSVLIEGVSAHFPLVHRQTIALDAAMERVNFFLCRPRGAIAVEAFDMPVEIKRSINAGLVASTG
ncbi:hypothetical protein [Streptomyces sp. CC228A]|uniref:hypothetical protein n=1 Tax=Streptomyces sp. CC228A TaxID=2898186 RepID=UPI001F1A1923|nr:hypothetical protein [Streptomyces sp. CC228A]